VESKYDEGWCLYHLTRLGIQGRKKDVELLARRIVRYGSKSDETNEKLIGLINEFGDKRGVFRGPGSQFDEVKFLPSFQIVRDCVQMFGLRSFEEVAHLSEDIKIVASRVQNVRNLGIEMSPYFTRVVKTVGG